MLRIESLSVNYGTRRILHDVSLNVQSGEVLALDRTERRRQIHIDPCGERE
jgi:ABC-type arginine transport system ATPase subunit